MTTKTPPPPLTTEKANKEKNTQISNMSVFSGFSKRMDKSDLASGHFRFPENSLKKFLTKTF